MNATESEKLISRAKAAAANARKAIQSLQDGSVERPEVIRAIEAAERAYDRARGAFSTVAEMDALWNEICAGLRPAMAAANEVARQVLAERRRQEIESLKEVSSRSDDISYTPGVGYVRGNKVIG